VRLPGDRSGKGRIAHSHACRSADFTVDWIQGLMYSMMAYFWGSQTWPGLPLVDYLVWHAHRARKDTVQPYVPYSSDTEHITRAVLNQVTDINP
jgi:hypothetical protein